MEKEHDSATHFIANKKENKKGFAITLYRFKGRPRYGQTECNCTPELKAHNSICHFCISENAGLRPQYLGPLGWMFHSAVKDSDVIPKLLPIEKLKEVTGDDLKNNKFSEDNIYAG